MSNPQSELVEFLAQFTHDPLGFVYSCFPWGKDELANYKGPDVWQIEYAHKRLAMNTIDVKAREC